MSTFFKNFSWPKAAFVTATYQMIEAACAAVVAPLLVDHLGSRATVVATAEAFTISGAAQAVLLIVWYVKSEES